MVAELHFVGLGTGGQRHDLMAQILLVAGLRLERVVVHAIEDNTFRAVLNLVNEAGGSTELDATQGHDLVQCVGVSKDVLGLE